MNIEFTALIKDNKIITVLQHDDDVINFIENVLDLETKNMDNKDMYNKIIDYVDFVQQIELEVL